MSGAGAEAKDPIERDGVMSLLPRTPSSRGLRPRNVALRSSSARLRSARLPRERGALAPRTPERVPQERPEPTHQQPAVRETTCPLSARRMVSLDSCRTPDQQDGIAKRRLRFLDLLHEPIPPPEPMTARLKAEGPGKPVYTWQLAG